VTPTMGTVRLKPARWFYVVYRLGFAALVFAALGTQIESLLDLDVFRPANFFSFFTVQANLIAASVFLYGAYQSFARDRTAPGIDMLRGASTAYMALTGIVFALLLQGLQEELQTHVAWVDFVLHKAMPVAVVVDWLLDPPDHRIEFRRALIWLTFPLLWLAYTLVRGEIAGWSPYPFVDAATHGYDHVASSSVAIFLGFLATVWITCVTGNLLRSRRHQAELPRGA